MALIGTLRNKMTTWVVAFVSLAILAFILGDLFGNSPTALFGGTDNTIGEIGGRDISLEEFQSAVQERENNYVLMFGRQAGERELTTLRQQAWDLLIARNAITPEYEKVGVEVTADEEWDMVQGRNADEGIKSSFTDSSGNFDRNKLIRYLQDVDALPLTSEQRVRWELYRRELSPARERIKYENLLLKTNYVTKAESEQRYHMDNDVAEIKYLYVPFYALRDSSVKVTDADLKAYYEKNKERFKTEELRSLSYIAIPLTPSAADSADVRAQADKLAAELASSTEDSTYAAINNEGEGSPYTRYNVATLPTLLSNQKASLKAGYMVGPVLEGPSYKVMKVSRVTTDTVYQMKANHILIKWENDTPEGKKAAKEKARKILSDIKGGARFADKAREFGTDGTATRGGDLGWFYSGQMVKAFEKPVADAKKTGLIGDVVETEFGYHIIEVTELKNNTVYDVATIELPVTPSDETTNEAFRKADTFAADLSDGEEFRERAAAAGYPVLDAKDISSSARRVGNLGESREIVTWLFREGKVDKVSTVFTLDEDYVVAVMTDKTDEGVKPFEKVKDQIMPAVQDQVYGKSIAEKLRGDAPLEELAKPFGNDAVVNSTSDVKLSGTSIPNIGFDPVAIGKPFSMEPGKRSEPFIGATGVVVMELVNKTVAPEMGDYSIFKTQVAQQLDNRNSLDIAEAIKKTSGIEDKRYKFY
jgi:peptidyl-prolyl cis-trans isomerase D